MDIELVQAYNHKDDVKAVFTEYTNMLIEGDSKFKEYLEIQNYNEELEHLERIKKELLASLDRVKKLEEKLFGEKTKEKSQMEKIKVKDVKQKEIKQEKIVSQEKNDDERMPDM